MEIERSGKATCCNQLAGVQWHQCASGYRRVPAVGRNQTRGGTYSSRQERDCSVVGADGRAVEGEGRGVAGVYTAKGEEDRRGGDGVYAAGGARGDGAASGVAGEVGGGVGREAGSLCSSQGRDRRGLSWAGKRQQRVADDVEQ